MSGFPISETDWYEQRDHRTKIIENISGFDSYKVGLVVGNEAAGCFNTQLMVWVASNILARWCRHLVIQIDDGVLTCLNGTTGSKFVNSLQTELLNIDPYLKLEFTSVKDTIDTVLNLSEENIPVKEKSVWIDSDGWRAGIGTGKHKRISNNNQDHNIIGPCFAACLGVAEIFRRATSKKRMQDGEAWYSLYDFSKSTDITLTNTGPYDCHMSLGHIHQIGCGAVGASLSFLLSFTDWKGEIDLIDFDSVDISNCNRSLPFSCWDVIDKTKKIKVCERSLSGNQGISTRPFDKDYSEFIKEGNFFKPPPDLILCLANDRGIWSTVQQNYPPLVYHATTTPNWGINFGRHIPKAEWCLLCRFYEDLQRGYKFIPPCADGTIAEQTDQSPPIIGALPFLSPMAAILILSELAKTAIPDYPINKSFIQFSSKVAEGAFLQSQAGIRENCVCTTQDLSSYPAKIKATKYWKYTEASSF